MTQLYIIVKVTHLINTLKEKINIVISIGAPQSQHPFIKLIIYDIKYYNGLQQFKWLMWANTT